MSRRYSFMEKLEGGQIPPQEDEQQPSFPEVSMTLEQVLIQMQSGTPFLQYLMSEGQEGVVVKKEIDLFYKADDNQGLIYWCLRGTNRMQPDKTLKLHLISDVYMGKQTQIFEIAQSQAPDECCCSIISQDEKKELNIEAQEKGVVEMWMSGISGILTGSGKEVHVDIDQEQAQQYEEVDELQAAHNQLQQQFQDQDQKQPQPSQPASPNGAEDGDRLMKIVIRGRHFISYVEDAITGEVTKDDIFLFYKPGDDLGAFFWCALGKREEHPDRCIRLREMTDVFVGKQTRAFEHKIAQRATPEQCCSFVSLRKTLNVQAADRKTLETWIAALNYIITVSGGGREMIVAEEGELEQDQRPPPGSGERSYPGSPGAPLPPPSPKPEFGQMQHAQVGRRMSIAVGGKHVATPAPERPERDYVSMSPEEIVEMMKEGNLFNNYVMKNGETSVRPIFLFYTLQQGGSICWQGENGQQFLLGLHEITDIFVGKQTKVFMKEKSLNAGCCFTMKGKNVTLNLVAETERLLAAWLAGIKHLVTNSGKDVVENEEEDMDIQVPTPRSQIGAPGPPAEEVVRRYSIMNREDDKKDLHSYPSNSYRGDSNREKENRDRAERERRERQQQQQQLQLQQQQQPDPKKKKKLTPGEIFEIMQKGSDVRLYNRNNTADEATIYAENGYLYATARGLNISQAFLKLQFRKITDMFLGKQTPGFATQIASGAPPANCFSIQSKKISLDIEAQSKEIVVAWIEGIRLTLTNNGNTVDLKNEGAEKGKHQRRWSVGSNKSGQGGPTKGRPTGGDDDIDEEPGRGGMNFEEALRVGSPFILYGSDNSRQDVTLRLREGKLMVSPLGIGAEYSFVKLPLKRITDIIIGKHTEVFDLPVARGADHERCISFISPKVKLNLEAENRRQVVMWLKGVQSVLDSGGQRMNKETMTGAPSSSRRYSVSVNQKDGSPAKKPPPAKGRLPETNSNDDIKLVTKGTNFTSYDMYGKKQMTLFVRDGRLYSCPIHKAPTPENSLTRVPIRNLTDIFVGKQTEVLKSSHARDAVASKCFALIFKSQGPDEAMKQIRPSTTKPGSKESGGPQVSYHLEAESKPIVLSWIRGLQKMLEESEPAQTRPSKPQPPQNTNSTIRKYSISASPQQPYESRSRSSSMDESKRLKEGSDFVSYNKMGSTTITMYAFGGVIYVCPWRQSYSQATATFSAMNITDIFVGKQTDVFRMPPSAHAVRERCFSIMTDRINLHLEAQSPQDIQIWLKGIQGMLQQKGKEVVLDAGKKTPGSQRRYSLRKAENFSPVRDSPILRLMNKGQAVTRYLVSGTQICTIFVRSGLLLCVPGTKADPKGKDVQKVPLRKLTDIFVGKQTEVMKGPYARKAPPTSCYSFVSKLLTLDIEFPPNADGKLWLQGIKELLSSTGKKVEEQSQRGRMGSFSIGGGDDFERRYSVSRDTRSAKISLSKNATVKMMMKGQVFTSYGTDNSPTRKLLFLFLNLNIGPAGGLYWCDPSEGRADYPENKCLLTDITDIYVGKHTKIFTHPIAAHAKAERCFSIVSNNTTLNLESEVPEILHSWLNGINLILSDMGREVYSETLAERRYSQISLMDGKFGDQKGGDLSREEQQEDIIIMEAGRQFTRYFRVNGFDAVDKQEVHFFLNSSRGPIGTLYWCQPGQRLEYEENSLPLDQLQNVFVGKQTEVFLSLSASLAVEERCVSLLGTRIDPQSQQMIPVELNLEASTVEVLSFWLDGINNLVKASGMEVAQGDEDVYDPQELKADGEEGGGRRFSVVDRGALSPPPYNMSGPRGGQPQHDEIPGGEKDGRLCVEMMIQGRVITMHKFDRRDQPSQKNVFVFFNPSQSKLGVLYWCEPGSREEIRKHSIAMHRITDLFIGKQTDVLQKASSADDDRCFSIITKHRTLNFEAESIDDVDSWVAGINHVLMSSGVQMKESYMDGEKSGNVSEDDNPFGSVVGEMTPRRDSVSRRKFSFMAKSHVQALGSNYQLPHTIPSNPMEAMKQMAQRRQTLVETSNKETIQMMMDGRVFTGYAENKKGQFIKKLLLVFYEQGSGEESGALYWCEPGFRKKSDSSCIALKDITDVFIGKHSKVLKSEVAQDAVSTRCFSLVGKTRTIDLEAKTEEELTAYLFGIQSILGAAGRKAVDQEEWDEKSGALGKDGRRFSVIAKEQDGKDHEGTWVAFIGLGAMGANIAKHLSQAATNPMSEIRRCYVWTRNQGKAVEHQQAYGSVALKNMTDCALADIIFTCLPTSNEVESVIGQLRHHLRPHTIIVDLTSGDPLTTKAIGTSLSLMGVTLLDAPLTGGPEQAREGTLQVTVGGAPRDYWRALPLIDVFAKKVTHVGPLGSGQALKSISNTIAATQLLVAAEGLAALTKMGVDPALALEVINVSSGASFMTQETLPQQIITRNFKGGMSLGLLRKDVALGHNLVLRYYPEASVLTHTLPIVNKASENIGPTVDYTEVVKVIEEQAGAEIES